jgi:chitodextrinase
MGFDELGGKTYACTTYGPNGDILRLDGTTWTKLYEGGSHDVGFYGDIKAFKGSVYASGEDRDPGTSVVYRWNGSSCTKVLDVVGGCFEKQAVAKDGAGTEWLYAPWTYGWRSTSGNARVYRTSDGTNWSLFQSFDEAESSVAARGENEYTLYVGTRQEGGHGKIYIYRADATSPSVPANVTATPQSETAIQVAWTASTDNIGVTGYKVYRNGSQVGTTASISYTNTGLTPSTTYSYTVSAYDAAGNNSAQSSPPAVATTPDNTAPSIPKNVAATAQSGTQIGVQWTASTDNVGVTGYKVYRNGSQVGTSATTSYTNTGLSPGTTYSYTVSAYDAAGNQSAQSSPPATARTFDTEPPSVPTDVQAVAQTPKTIKVTWTASTDNVNVTGYKVYRNGGQVGTSATTSYVDTGLSPNTTYSYSVSAYDAASNESDQSSPPATAATMPAINITDAKRLGDSTTVGLVSKTVTGVFPDHLYIEETDRNIGIKVVPVEMPSGLFIGSIVDVGGTMQTDSNGERYIYGYVIAE